MLKRFLRSALPSMFACAFAPQLAHADVYTWVDASGAVNVSNLAPPEGVRVTHVAHESAPRSAAYANAARDAAQQAELQVLSERVRQLESEVQLAARQVPPPIPIQYAMIPAPPVVQYVVEPAAAPVSAGCDSGWTGCGPWWNSGFFPAGSVVVLVPNFRRSPAFRGGHHVPVQRPMFASGGGFQRR
ncbi:MAG: DUF4124 domain-containing protein [Betaproteobacteria bacterium]